MDCGNAPVSAFAVYSKRNKVVSTTKLKRLKPKKKSSFDVSCLYKENTSKGKKSGASIQHVKDIAKQKKKPKENFSKIKSVKGINKLIKNPEEIELKRQVPQLAESKETKEAETTHFDSILSAKKIPEKRIKQGRKKRMIETPTNVVSNSCIADTDENNMEVFQWLISPFKIDEFFEKSWEQQPVLIKRKNEDYYKDLMSTPIMDTIFRDNHILFTKNVDITSYFEGVRETHNPPGRALPSIVWDYYGNGCSVRMLNPQTFIPQLHKLNADLQEFFGCFVGANSYLTPPNSQGFAPHFDDIEAFILQIEGKKRWRLYKPRDEDYLARFSSKNFDQSEIGEPIMDTIVNAGDLLYFPRGTIHQGETVDNSHSLHITLSVYQRNSWSDFLEKLLPKALEHATKKYYRFREGLPLGCLRNVGFAHSENKSIERKAFFQKVEQMLQELLSFVDVDEAADQMAKGHIHDFLPPMMSNKEAKCSALRDGWVMRKKGMVDKRADIQFNTRIRLLRSHCARLVEEEDTFRIYYSTENSKEYHEYELQYLEIDQDLVPAFKELIERYPDYIKVEDLPVPNNDIDLKIQITKDLWEKCIVVTDGPLSRVLTV